MKDRNNKILTLVFLLLFSMASLFTNNISAKEFIKSNELTEYEQFIINDLEQNDPDFYISDNETVVAANRYIMTENELSFESDTEGSTVTPYNLLSNNYMTMNIAIFRVNTSKPEDRFRIYTSFEWLKEPNFKLKDAIAVEWSDSFTMTSAQLNLTYQYSGMTISESTSNYDSVALEAGVGFSFAMDKYQYTNSRPYTQQYVLKRGSMNVYIVNIDRNGYGQISANYAHSQLSLANPSFSFDGNISSFGISIVGAYDKGIVSKSFKY